MGKYHINLTNQDMANLVDAYTEGSTNTIEITIDSSKGIKSCSFQDLPEETILRRALENMHKDWFFRDQRSIEDCLKEAERQLNTEILFGE